MFKDQVSLPVQVETLFFLAPLVATALALAGVFMLDAGLTRVGNVLHTITQKLVALAAGAFGISLIGYGIWNWQYYKALGIPSPLKEAIGDWWLGGTNMTTLPQHLDPQVVPTADAFQIFFAAFVIFAAFFAALLASAALERVKTLSLGVIAFVFGALIIPLIAYSVYGSVGPLSNNGTHEYAGAFFYLVLATWALVLAWRAGPRASTAAGSSGPPNPHNLTMTAIGLVFIMAGLSGYIVANGFLVPDGGYFGITLSESGIGIVFTNIWMAFVMGTFGGLLAWRMTHHIFYFFVSPIAGWISISAMADVVDPWQAGLVAFFAPLFVVLGARLTRALKIDDPKIVPLTLLPSLYGILATAIFATNVNQGGYFGLEGDYALGHAEITFGDQLLGAAVFLGGGLLSAFVVILAVEKTIGLRDRRIDEGAADALDLVVIGEAAYGHLVAPSAAHADGSADGGQPVLTGRATDGPAV